MTKYITFNKGTIDKLPTLEKRARYYHNEIKGLHIDVRSSGLKSFKINYKMNAYSYTYTIGGYPETPPAVAIDRAREIKASLAKGFNPQEEKINKRKEKKCRIFNCFQPF